MVASGRGTMPSSDSLSLAWSEVNSCVSWPDVVYMPTRSEGASESNSRLDAARTDTASCINISVSSKTKATKRCGIGQRRDRGAASIGAGERRGSRVGGHDGMRLWSFQAESRDRLGLAIVLELKIFLFQIGDDVALGIADYDAHAERGSREL